jgi:ElaA protein
VTVELRRAWARDLEAPTLYALLRLRVDVFVVEQNCPYPELDGRDLEPQTRHFWLQSPGGAVISTLRLLQDDPDDPDGESVFRIGRVCTEVSERGRGHTTRLMNAALAEIGEQPCRISAQTYLAQMYARHGFVTDGTEFDEDGIAHVPMLRAGRR